MDGWLKTDERYGGGGWRSRNSRSGYKRGEEDVRKGWVGGWGGEKEQTHTFLHNNRLLAAGGTSEGGREGGVR